MPHTAHIIDGKKLAEPILAEIKNKVSTMNQKPGLAILLIGHDPASQTYVKLKKKTGESLGIGIHTYLLDQNAPEDQILQVIDFLNNDPDIHGIIVQLPLPKHLDEDKIILKIDPRKDVDGFHPENRKRLKEGKPRLIPGLALAIYEMIISTGEVSNAKSAAIIGNSEIFAEPLEYLLRQKNIHVSSLRPDDPKIKEKTQDADIIIIAVGRKHFLQKDWVKNNAAVIDVGINRLASGKITGDVAKNVWQKAQFISPVPGGVGPMTVAMLFFNTVLLSEAASKNKNTSP